MICPWKDNVLQPFPLQCFSSEVWNNYNKPHLRQKKQVVNAEIIKHVAFPSKQAPITTNVSLEKYSNFHFKTLALQKPSFCSTLLIIREMQISFL